MSKYIQIEPNENGSHNNQNGGDHPGEGWAVIPDNIVIPDSFPFVSITVEDGDVTGMTACEVPERTEPVKQPTQYEILRADVDFIMAMEGYI